jgi:hypothetical protein
MLKLQTGCPDCVYLSSGSLPSLPMSITLFSVAAISALLEFDSDYLFGFALEFVQSLFQFLGQFVGLLRIPL